MSIDAAQIPAGVPAAWAAGADALARWAWDHLVNRTDVWGGYRPPHLRTKGCKVWTLPARKDRGRIVLTVANLRAHFVGRRERDVRGLHSTSPANSCRWIGWDLDAHQDEQGVAERNLRAAMCWLEKLRKLGFRVLLMDSNGGGGLHLLLVFQEPVPSPLAYRFAQWVIKDWKAMGFRAAPEAFPKQPQLERSGSGRGGCGNWMRLPGRHHTRAHWTRVWEGESEEEADKAYVQEDLSCLGEDVGRRMQAVEERSEHATELIGLVLSRTGHDLASELMGVWEAFGHFCSSRVGLSAQQVLAACGYPGREQLASWLKAYAHVKPNVQTVAGYREGLCGVWDRRFGEE